MPKDFYSLQIGNEFLLASRTKIKTVSNFRNMDIASNGEGAPLIPLFHKYLLHTKNIKKVYLSILEDFLIFLSSIIAQSEATI